MKDILNIIGRGRGCRHGLKQPGEVWVVNVYRPGATMLFQMHDPTIPEIERNIQKAIDEGIPYTGLNNYPLDLLIDHFKTNFFSNSICYMLAFGIYKEFKKIDLWGCNIRSNANRVVDFYVKNHPGVEFWIGMAMGRGIEICIHGDSALLTLPGGKMYGYNY